MRMTIYQLVAQEIDDIHYIEMLLLLTNLGIKQHMKQHISKFLRKLAFLPFENGITEFIHLLQSLWAQRFVGLFPVPRALDPQFIQHIQNPSKCLQYFFSCMHSIVFFSKG